MEFISYLAFQTSLVLTVIVAIASFLLYRSALRLINSLTTRVSQLEKQLSERDGRISELERIVEHWKTKFNDLWQKYIELEQENRALKNRKKLL